MNFDSSSDFLEKKNLQEIQSFNLAGYSYSEEYTIDSNSPVFIR